MENIEMTQKSFKQYRLGIEVLEGKLTIVDYAILIDKSYRQAQRIINKSLYLEIWCHGVIRLFIKSINIIDGFLHIISHQKKI